MDGILHALHSLKDLRYVLTHYDGTQQLEQLVAEVRVHEKEGGVAGEVCSKMWKKGL